MILDKITAVLAEKTGVEASSIKAETTFRELNLDSLDTVDILMGLEDTFGVSLELSEGTKCVGDVVSLIEQAGGRND